jgi:hypothetical protein
VSADPATGPTAEAAAPPATETPGALPNLIVIGAQKCGTSSLHYYLSLHPEVSMSQPKELDFFLRRRNWQHGVDWYRRHFDPDAKVRGESSPNYTAYPLFRGVAKRIRSVVPEAKLIYIVRDPLERIAAHWVHNYAVGRTTRSLSEMRHRDRRTYVARSKYHRQLRRFLRHYPMERILVLEQDDLRSRRDETLRTVFEFAGLDPEFRHPNFRREQHKTERKARSTPLGERLSERRARASRHLLPDEAWALARERWPLARRIEPPDVREALPDKVLVKLRTDAERLRELTGRPFAHWSIWEL